MRSLATGLLLTILILAGCQPAPAQPVSSAGPSQPADQRAVAQVLRVAQVGLPANMTLTASAGNAQLYWLMYDNLVAFDAKFGIVPSAATRWEQTEPKTWRLYLRRDLTFSNGDPLTAADVEFTGRFILDRKTPQLDRLTSLSDVRRVDDYTVDFIGRVPDASTLAGLSYVWIMPKKHFDQVGLDGFTTKPVGSGPYELAEFRNADFARFQLRRTPHAFRKPVATEVTVRSLTQATSTIAGLRTGDVDLAIGQFTSDQIQAMKLADIVVHRRAISNLSILIPMREMEERQSPLRDKRVRMALNYAVNKEALSRSFYGGDAEVAGQLATPSSPFWDSSIPAYPYDPKLARQLLAEAGYPNGLTLPNGLDFTPQTSNSDVMLAVQGFLRDVGISMPVNAVELGVFLDKFYARNGQNKGDLFAVTLSEPNGFATPARGNLSCDKPALNIWWCNRDFDRFLDQASAEADITKRAALMHQAARAITGDVSHIYLLSPPFYVVHNTKVKGFVWTSDVYYNFDSVYRVD